MNEELKEFGLTENEIKIYLTLLKLGTSSPAEVGSKTGFSRPYVYDVLQRLLEKQMVSTILKKNKKNYTAVDPKNLIELARGRLEGIEKIMPELNRIKNSATDEMKVEIHRGKYVYKIVINDVLSTLKNNDEVLIYGIEEDTMENLGEFMPIYLDRYFSKIREKNITEKVITKMGGKIISQAKTTKYRFLPKEVIGKTAFHVYANKVAIFLWGEPNCLILIESKEVADSYRNQFKILWEKAKP